MSATKASIYGHTLAPVFVFLGGIELVFGSLGNNICVPCTVVSCMDKDSDVIGF